MGWFSTVFVLFIFSISFSIVYSSREVTSTLNPFCPEVFNLSECSLCRSGSPPVDCGFNNLLYYKAVGPDDILHYFISTMGVPSVMMFQGDLNSTVDVSWSPSFLAVTTIPIVTVTNVISVLGMSLTKLYRFNDVSDTGDIGKMNESDVEQIPLDFIHWDTAKMGDTVELNSLPDQFGPNATLKLRVNVFDKEGRHDIVPRIVHSDSMGLLEVVLDNFSHLNMSDTRFAAELAFVRFTPNEPNATNITVGVDETSSINDEFSPGVFRDYIITVRSGFLTWKPMVYRTPARGFESATLMCHDDLTQNNGDLSHRGLISRYNGGSLLNEVDPRVVIRSFNVTFGKPKDKFYNNFNYHSWSIAFGMGRMPRDGFSPLLISLIFACFGLPALAIVLGTGFYLFRRFKAQRDELNEPLTG